MNFWTYINESPLHFWENYIEPGYVSVQSHAEFPLSIYAYGRKTVCEQKWDGVTTKCRGIIVNNLTGEIVSRPFEKFHNYGAGSDAGVEVGLGEPVIWEKMDGFMCTLYTWEGIDYIASKGSFHSIHAKWATAWLRAKFGPSMGLPTGYTAVFEGLHPDLRIVVDYHNRKELVLLAIIDNETGEEFDPRNMMMSAAGRGIETPHLINTGLAEVHARTMKEDAGSGDEGFVLSVSPKRIWEVLAGNQTPELDEYLKQSTPWFTAFVQKWMKALTLEYNEIEHGADASYGVIQGVLNRQWKESGNIPVRKDWALLIQHTPEFVKYAGILFAKLDGKDERRIIWKMVKQMTHGHNPMVDAHNT
jgi:RNA ligase